MWSLFVAAVVVVAALIWYFVKGSGYGAIFHEKHLAEFAGRVRVAKAAALRHVGDDSDTDAVAEGRAFVSSAGISFFYTVGVGEDGGFLHHYSISRPDGILPHGVGEPFTIFIAKVIGAPIERLSVEAKAPRFFHCRFGLSGEEEEGFAGQGMHGEMSVEEARVMFADCQALRAGVFGR